MASKSQDTIKVKDSKNLYDPQNKKELLNTVKDLVPTYLIFVSFLYYFFARHSGESTEAANIFIAYGGAVALFLIFYFFVNLFNFNEIRLKNLHFWFLANYLFIAISIVTIVLLNGDLVTSTVGGEIAKSVIFATVLYLIGMPLMGLIYLLDGFVKDNIKLKPLIVPKKEIPVAGLQEYFNKNGGIFTAMAVFSALMVFVSSLKPIDNTMNFLAFSGFFITFVLISYLLNDLRKIPNLWFWLLFLGYNLLFVALLLFGLNKFPTMIEGPFFEIVLGIVVLFYGWINVRLLIEVFKRSG